MRREIEETTWRLRRAPFYWQPKAMQRAMARGVELGFYEISRWHSYCFDAVHKRDLLAERVPGNVLNCDSHPLMLYSTRERPSVWQHIRDTYGKSNEWVSKGIPG